MSKFLMSLFISAIIISNPAIALADETAPKQVFEERYAAMKSAMAKRDGNEMASLLAPNFVSTDVSGKNENAAQMVDEVKNLPIDPLKESKTTINSVKINGDTAIVEQSYDMKTKKVAADGSTKNIELITASEDTWVNSKGIWLCQSTTTNQLDYFINGQAAIHKVRQH